MFDRFNTYLRFKRLSQKAVSEMSAVGRSMISRFCNGKPIPSDRLLKILLVCEDLSLDWFFFGTGDMIRSLDRSHTTVNVGAFAGADVVSDDSVLVKNANGVNVNKQVSKSLMASIAEKDRIICEKDAVICSKDAVISERDSTISYLSGLLTSGK